MTKLDSARALVFQGDFGRWSQVAELDFSGAGGFGQSVAISGTDLLVGARSAHDGKSSAGIAQLFTQSAAGPWEPNLSSPVATH